MPEPTHDPELAALQAALSRLRPAPDGINVARLLFCAGQASVPRRGWAWPCATAASALLAAALGSVLLLRPVPQRADRLVIVRVETPPPAEPPAARAPAAPGTPAAGAPEEGDREPSRSDYLRLRRGVLANGVEAFPPPAPWPTAGPPNETDTLLDMPRGAGGPWLLWLKHSLQSGGAS
jgi:hypothetical protein